MDNNKLRKSLIRNFLITLLLIGIAQMIINTALMGVINPLIEDVLSMNGMLSSSDVRGTFIIIFSSLFVLSVQKLAGSVSALAGIAANEVLSKWFDPSIVSTMNELSTKIHGESVVLYLLKAVGIFLLVVAFWLTPYIVAAISFSRVMTKRVNELEEVRIKRDKEIEKQRNLLLSDIAHDIKTPITTVAGFSKALSDGTVPKGQEEDYLKSLYNKSMQISELVNLLFEYVKLDSAGYSLNLQSCDYAELVRNCIAGAYADFEDKKMDLTIDIPEEEIILKLDRTQISRAINNLLVNTIRHNAEGTQVMIELKVEGKERVLSISDNGLLIDRDTAKRLFDPFVQGDESRSGGKGSGLGLSITRKIVEMHGGKVRLIQYLDKEKYSITKTFEIRL